LIIFVLYRSLLVRNEQTKQKEHGRQAQFPVAHVHVRLTLAFVAHLDLFVCKPVKPALVISALVLFGHPLLEPLVVGVVFGMRNPTARPYSFFLPLLGLSLLGLFAGQPFGLESRSPVLPSLPRPPPPLIKLMCSVVCKSCLFLRFVLRLKKINVYYSQ
jgi:hypothetical protein